MTPTEVDKRAWRFIKEHKLHNIDYASLSEAAENLGYTVVEYSSAANDPDVADLVDALELNYEIRNSRGFTFAYGEYRLVFINEDLSLNEKLIVMSHELGHIVLDHLTRQKIVGKDVQEEYEANEFSNFLLKSNSKLYVLFSCCKTQMTVAAGLVIVLAGGILLGTFGNSLISMMKSNNTEADSENIQTAAPVTTEIQSATTTESFHCRK